jgi:hypothetical protein
MPPLCIPPLAVLIADHPEIGAELARTYEPKYVSEAIEQAIALTASGCEVLSLTGVQATKLANVLSCCPPDILVDEYGVELAIFCSIQGMIQQNSLRINMHLSESADVKSELLEHARLGRWRMFHDVNFSSIQAIYNLLSSLKTDEFDQEEFRQFIFEQEKDEGHLSQTRLKDYRVDLLHPKHDVGAAGYDEIWGRRMHENGKKYDIWHDAPMSLGLMYKGEPQAIVGFTALDSETLLVIQIQGTRPMTKDGIRGSRGLAKFSDWSGTMIKYLEFSAKKWGFEKICIQGAEGNIWIGENHLPKDKALEVYDGKAEYLGYDPPSENGRWLKEL